MAAETTPDLINDFYQVAVFPNNFTLDNTNPTFDSLIGTELFDGQNELLPIPQDAPRDIPRMILRNSAGTFTLELSFSKILLTWSDKDNDDLDIPISEITTTVQKILTALNSTQTYWRVGYINQFYFLENEPQKLAAKTIFKHELGDMRDFNVKITNKITVGDFEESNEHLLFMNGKRNRDGENIIIVNADINTHQDQKLDWNIGRIIKYIEDAKSRTSNQDIFKRFFKE